MEYEIFYLVGESKNENLDKIKKEVEKIITQEGGEFSDLEISENRKLAYEINKETRGNFIARRFEIGEDKDENIFKNLNKKLNLYNGILRFMIIRADELPELKPIERRDVMSKKGKVPALRASGRPRREEKPFSKNPEKKVEEKPKEESAEDMDKKLEEILNI